MGWRRSALNIADHITKHHPASQHQQIRSSYLHAVTNPSRNFFHCLQDELGVSPSVAGEGLLIPGNPGSNVRNHVSTPVTMPATNNPRQTIPLPVAPKQTTLSALFYVVAHPYVDNATRSTATIGMPKRKFLFGQMCYGGALVCTTRGRQVVSFLTHWQTEIAVGKISELRVCLDTHDSRNIMVDRAKCHHSTSASGIIMVGITSDGPGYQTGLTRSR